MSEKFCLKWNDFHSNASKSFGLLRNEKYLFDVTLVSDDNKQVSAHKLVLSACSEYFKNIFRNNSEHQHPLLCLYGITSNDLTNVLDYIYDGEVKILQEELDRFLVIAQKLKLEGLLGVDEKKDEKSYYKEGHIMKGEEDLKSYNTNVVEAENIVSSKPSRQLVQKVPVQRLSDIELADVQQKVDQYIEKSSDGSFQCKMCGKNCGKVKTNMRNHIETHLEGLSFSCQICGKIFRSKNSINCHKYQIHKQQ